jgi:hypothetical protein
MRKIIRQPNQPLFRDKSLFFFTEGQRVVSRIPVILTPSLSRFITFDNSSNVSIIWLQLIPLFTYSVIWIIDVFTIDFINFLNKTKSNKLKSLLTKLSKNLWSKGVPVTCNDESVCKIERSILPHWHITTTRSTQQTIQSRNVTFHPEEISFQLSDLHKRVQFNPSCKSSAFHPYSNTNTSRQRAPSTTQFTFGHLIYNSIHPIYFLSSLSLLNLRRI